MDKMSRWLARRLRGIAQRLDQQPTVAANRSGGWTISFPGQHGGEIPLAHISPGMITDSR